MLLIEVMFAALLALAVLLICYVLVVGAWVILYDAPRVLRWIYMSIKTVIRWLLEESR